MELAFYIIKRANDKLLLIYPAILSHLFVLEPMMKRIKTIMLSSVLTLCTLLLSVDLYAQAPIRVRSHNIQRFQPTTEGVGSAEKPTFSNSFLWP